MYWWFVFVHIISTHKVNNSYNKHSQTTSTSEVSSQTYAKVPLNNFSKCNTSFNKASFSSIHITMQSGSLHSKPEWLQVTILSSIMTFLYYSPYVKLPKSRNIYYNCTVNVHLFITDNDASIILSFISYLKPMPFKSCLLCYLSMKIFTTFMKEKLPPVLSFSYPICLKNKINFFKVPRSHPLVLQFRLDRVT